MKRSLVDAFRGQNVLVITLTGFAGKDTRHRLVDAAIEAGVRYIMPNEWSPDTANEALVADVFPFATKPPIRKKIATGGQGRAQYNAVTTGFWYEWSMAIARAYGFDFANKTVVFYDDGNTIIDTSTWPQVGRAVAALLSLPIESEDGGEKPLARYGDQQIYVDSLAVSQADIFMSVLQVTGTKAEDWNISHESSQQRYADGLEQMKQGQKVGFAKMMYTRVFFPEGCGSFSKSKGTVNDLLGLPKENLDGFTAIAIERSKQTQWV